MSAPVDAFKAAFGVASPAVGSGVRYRRMLNRGLGEELHAEVGSGWFRDGFLFLFGEGLEGLDACLEAWAFLVPPNAKRTIIGRNAYGAILVVDNESEPGVERVFLLDPFTVTYTEVPNARFVSLIARALPQGELRTFLDDRAYREWCAGNDVDRPAVDQVLGVKVPEGLGGTLTSDNLQLEDIVDYYRTTGPIYEAALGR